MKNDSRQNLDHCKILHRSAGHLVKQVQEGLIQLTFFYPAPTNCWLLKDSDGLILVDAGSPWNAAAIIEAVNCTGSQLRRIVITHGHPDHAGAAAAVAKSTGATVYAHESELPFLQGKQSMADLPGFWMTSAFLKSAKLLGMLDPPVCVDAQPLLAGDSIGSLQILHTPGHTPGSISLWDEQRRAIFSGDNILFNQFFLQFGLPWFTLDLETQAKSIVAYENLAARLILPGHGGFFSGDVPQALRRLDKSTKVSGSLS